MNRERRTKDVRTLHSVDLDVTTQMPASDTSSRHQNEYLVWHWNLLVKGDSQRFPLKQFEAQKIGATLSSYEQLWSSKTVCLDGPKCFKGSSDSVFHCRSRFVANQQLKSIASSLASAVCAGRDHNCKPFSDVPWKHRNETWQKCLPVRRFCKGAILMQRIPALWDTTRCTGHASAGVWSRFPQRGADLYRRVSMGFIHASPTTCAVSDRLQFYSHFLNSVWMGLEYIESWLGTPTCTKTCAAQVNMRTMKTSRVFHCTSALDKLILRFCFRWCRMFFITREWRGEIATVVMFLQNRWVAIDPTTWEWKIPILPPLNFPSSRTADHSSQCCSRNRIIWAITLPAWLCLSTSHAVFVPQKWCGKQFFFTTNPILNSVSYGSNLMNHICPGNAWDVVFVPACQIIGRWVLKEQLGWAKKRTISKSICRSIF